MVTFYPTEKFSQKSPLPPFSKGGLGGISEINFPLEGAWQDIDILRLIGAGPRPPILRRDN